MTTEHPFVPEWYWRNRVPINGEINGLIYQDRWESLNNRLARQIMTKLVNQGCRCFYCDIPLPDDRSKIVREHRIPRSKGGGGGRNIVASCPSCDKNKKARLRPDDDFINQKRQLLLVEMGIDEQIHHNDWSKVLQLFWCL